ncbi:hypothetical protein V8E53_005370 [Lactarius tabidus]
MDLEKAAPKITTGISGGTGTQYLWRMERVSYYQCSLKVLFSRNKVKPQAYQQEYAQIKQALGQRKIGKEGCGLLEMGQVKKHQVMAMEDLPVSQKSALGQPQGLKYMIQMEEQAQEYFLETRETLQLFSLSCWIEPFQKHVNDFIQEQLAEAAKIMAVLGKEPEDAI